MTDLDATTVPATDPNRTDASEPTPPTRRDRDLGEILGWLVLVGLSIWVLSGTFTHEYDHRPIVGDQANNMMQMLSIAHDGHNLSYDALDIDRWGALHWMEFPLGLYSQRFNDGDGWAFAKPYGYSLWLVVPYRLFGSPAGIAVGNSLLLIGLIGVAIATLRLWLRGAAVPLVTAAFVYASNAYMHAYPVVVDLFTAVVVGVAVYAMLRGLRDANLWWQAAGFATFGFLLSEKLPLLVAIAPLAVLCLWRARTWTARVMLVGATVAVFAVAVVPYLYYSDGRAWTAYGGERYYSGDDPPFHPNNVSEPRRVDSDEVVTLSYAWSKVTSPSSWLDSVESSAYYIVGRHTGLIVTFPIALFVLAMALARLRILPGEALAALVGLGLYIAFYLALFPDNYYGGGQAIGNRYFLQVSPLVLGIAAAGRLPSRALVTSALLAGALSLSFMWTHHDRPSWAIVDLERKSWAQQFLPFERNQLGADYWRCGFGDCSQIDDD